MSLNRWVAAHIIKPRLGDGPIFSIESINVNASVGVSVEQMRGKRFDDLCKQLFELDAAIVNVSASNVEDFLDTLRTIQVLAGIGIPAEKNPGGLQQAGCHRSPTREFPAIFGLAALENSFIANPLAAIHSNEVFDGIKDVQRSITDLANDPTDYRAQLKTLTDPAEREHCVHVMGLKMLAKSATKDMDQAFAALTA